MNLACRQYGQSGPPLIILHGLFGSKENWHGIARRLSTDLRVFTIDQRNHGESPHRNQHDYRSMADDLAAFQTANVDGEAMIMGHSMGGKTAMQYALTYPARVTRLVVVDMHPEQGRVRHETVFKGLALLDRQRIESRQQAESTLMQTIGDITTCRFLLKNLRRGPDGSYSLKLNLAMLHCNYAELLAPVAGPPYPGPALFIRGALSDYLPAGPTRRMRRLFPAATMKTVDEAGHWVHWEQPEKLAGIVREFAGRGKI